MALLLVIAALTATTCVATFSKPFDLGQQLDLGYIFNDFGLPDYSQGSTGGQQFDGWADDYYPKSSGNGPSWDDLWGQDTRRPSSRPSDPGYGDRSQYPSNPLPAEPVYGGDARHQTRYPIDIPAEVQQPSRVPGSYPVQKYPTPPYQTPEVPVYGIDSDRNNYNAPKSVPKTDHIGGFGKYPTASSGNPLYPASQTYKDSEEKIYPVDPVVTDLYDTVKGGLSIGGPGASILPSNTPQHTYPVDVYNYRHGLKCQPEFFFEYERDFSGPVWQDAQGDVLVQNGRAVFGGHGSIAIPFFTCNDLLPRYSMSFVLSPSNIGGNRAVLGNSLRPDKASFLVSLTGSALRLTIRERAADLKPEQVLAACWQRKKRSVDGLPYFRGGLGASSPAYGNVIVLELPFYSGGQTLVTVTQENDWIFFSAGNQRMAKRGRLPTLTNEPLYVGAGADPLGQTTLSNYVGTFDSFLFEKCPKDQ